MKSWLGPTTAGASLATIFVIGGAHAEESASDLLRKYDVAGNEQRYRIELILSSTENGMSWFGAEARVDLYCLPKNLALTGNQIIDIMRRQISEVPSIGAQPYGFAVLQSLKRVFPCPVKR